jgi:hypothetical protein
MPLSLLPSLHDEWLYEEEMEDAEKQRVIGLEDFVADDNTAECLAFKLQECLSEEVSGA